MNPILPLAYATPDVEAHVWPQDPNRVYLYCSNDRIDGGGMSPCQHCFSSEDLVHWTDHGVAFDASTAIPWVSMTDLPAIDVAEKNGRWYHYFTVHSACTGKRSFLCLRGWADLEGHISAELRKYRGFMVSIARDGGMSHRPCDLKRVCCKSEEP